MILKLALWLLLGFLAGSLPFAVWIGRLRGIDIRAHGSGNPGATNVGRTVGWGWGALVLVLDAAKAAMPTAAALFLAGVPAAVGTAVAAVAGHTFSPFLQFKGGKGVASALGGLLILSPLAAAVSLAVFAAVVGIGRIVSLGSVAAAIALPLALWLTQAPVPVLGYGTGIALLVVGRHRANLRRILNGTEPRLGRPAKESSPP